MKSKVKNPNAVTLGSLGGRVGGLSKSKKKLQAIALNLAKAQAVRKQK